MSMPTGPAKNLENEINVTPMIDVLLVLLIIFMAALPAMRKAIDVQLPPPQTEQTPQPNQNLSIVLEVLPGGAYAINKEPVPKENLDQRLREIYVPGRDKVLFVKGDPTVKYQDVIEAMDVARGAGVLIIGVPPKDLPGSGAAPASN